MKNRMILVSLAIILAISVGLIGCGGEEAPEITKYNLTISSTEGSSVTTPGQGTGSFTYDEGEVVRILDPKLAGEVVASIETGLKGMKAGTLLS